MNKELSQKWLPILTAGFSGIFYLFIIFKYNWFINSGDFFITEFLALSQFTGNPQAFTSPAFPFGYPFLVNIMSIFTGDYLLSVKLLCAISGGLIVYITYKLSYLLFKNFNWALLTSILVAINPHIIFGSVGEDQDILLSAVLLWSVYIAMKDTQNKENWFYAGLIVGISSLIRQHGIILAGIYVPVILIENYRTVFKSWIMMIIYLAMGTLIGAAPQLIMNVITHGNPFYNYLSQSGTVLTALEEPNVLNPKYGNLFKQSASLSFLNIFSNHFLSVAKHWFNVGYIYTVRTNLLYALIAGIILFIFDKQREKIIISTFILIVGFTAFISLAYYVEKGTYFPVALTYLFYMPAGSALSKIKPYKLFKVFGGSLIILITIILPGKDSINLISYLNELRQKNNYMSIVLKQNGMTSPKQCITTSANISFFDSIHNPYKLENAIPIFKKSLSKEGFRAEPVLNKLGFNNLYDIMNSRLFRHIHVYLPYLVPGSKPYVFDIEFRESFSQVVWFDNIFSLEQLMHKYDVKFVIIDANWTKSYVPLFPDLFNNTNLGPDFKLVYTLYGEGILVYKLVR